MPTSSTSAQNPGLRIARIRVPDADEAVPGSDFGAFLRMGQAHELGLWGNLDRSGTPAEERLHWRGSRYEECRVHLAWLDGVPVARGALTLPLTENTTTARVEVLVDPAYRRRGIASALLAVLEEDAGAAGRRIFDSYCEEPLPAVPGASSLLGAKSGSGGVPAEAASTCFALRHGYELEQVETNSVLSLPPDAGLLADLEGEALLKAGGYSVFFWQDSCPEGLVEAYAALKSTMTTEVPLAGLGWEGEVWDVERVREEERKQSLGCVRSTVAVARHNASGELAAYTVLTHRDARPAAVIQEDTLVAPGHRGRRLGLLVKIANVRRAQALWPAARAVMTWNASENRHMLAINIALGFRPSGFEGEWQKRLG